MNTMKPVYGEDNSNSSSSNGHQSKQKYYAIAFGRKIGVFNVPWDQCRFIVERFLNAKYKGFSNAAEGWKYINDNNKEENVPIYCNVITTLYHEELQTYKAEWEQNKMRAFKKSDINELVIDDVKYHEIVDHEQEVGRKVISWKGGVDAMRQFRQFLDEYFEDFEDLTLSEVEELVMRENAQRQKQSVNVDFLKQVES